MSHARTSRHAFWIISALLFVVSWSVTIQWCASMSAMGEMPMTGGWAMSMVWMRMPGQTWGGTTASFVGMWVVMMAAMMLPSLVPMLWRYRETVGGVGAGWLTVVVGLGYFFAWTLFGLAVFPAGVALAAILLRQPALARGVPMVGGVAMVIAGVFQLIAWKARRAGWCSETSMHGETLSADSGAAWRHGVRLGVQCAQCCAGLMAIQIVMGIMNPRVMAVVAAVITLERLVPAAHAVASGPRENVKIVTGASAPPSAR